ncbi:MAG: hypothetical protein QOJ99_2621 [Bryobacterales bacterium]|jgi:hypothetical protein|nr:hypothetical protein [Bryobacterales bacterium]
MVETLQLPPLILHPFSGGGNTQELLDGSKASLALNGLGSAGSSVSDGGRSREDDEELFRRVLTGRYQEIRMLLFLGKDLFRWMQQCVDFVGRSGAGNSATLQPGRMNEQSFAALVVEEPPAAVQLKLDKWGVSDRRAIFSRAIGVNSLFSSPPPAEALSPLFLQNYHRYADHAYICFQHLKPFHALDRRQFDFEMYASEEYARLLSEQWQRV